MWKISDYESQYQTGLYLEDLLSFFVKDHFICGVRAVFVLTKPGTSKTGFGQVKIMKEFVWINWKNF